MEIKFLLTVESPGKMKFDKQPDDFSLDYDKAERVRFTPRQG